MKLKFNHGEHGEEQRQNVMNRPFGCRNPVRANRVKHNARQFSDFSPCPPW
jgi:hypothetical protein